MKGISKNIIHPFRNIRVYTFYAMLQIICIYILLDDWTDYSNQTRFPGDRTTTQLHLLKPAQAYHVRLYSENDIGISAPSDVLFIITDSEVPSAPH